MSFFTRIRESIKKSPDTSRLRILVTNDDGIHAPGLEVLERIARELSDEVWVVAPEAEQSGAGHSLTIHNPLRLRQIAERRYAVGGTPTDCVLLAVKAVLREHPVDLILSGVNRGANIGEDITYSGTVAAAMEGTLIGIPSIAMSQCCEDAAPVRWEVAERHAPTIIRRVLAAGWPANNLININFPDVEPEKVKGVRPSPHGQRKIGDKLIRREDPRARPYYWIGDEGRRNGEFQPGCDIAAVNEGYISVTPICMDMTDYKTLEMIRETFEHESV